MSAVLRFAPSPNGPLHLGHAYSALLNEEMAARLCGIWLLRIEDIDPARSRPEHISGILDDLAWLGLRWPEPVWRQSARLESYRAAAGRLRDQGLLYPCFCSRGDIAAAVVAAETAAGGGWPRDPDGAPLYPGTCRGLPAAAIADRMRSSRRPAWRLDMAAACTDAPSARWRSSDREGREAAVPARPERWGDPVIVRRDVPTSYHLAVVVDDAAQGITHVVRGADLEAATDVHAVLGRLLGLPQPLYHHHRLVLGDDGAKLSKSRRSPSLADMRKAGVAPAEIRARLGFAARHPPA